MPRYFFNLANGGREIDELGLELPNNEAARLEAVSYAGELLRSHPQQLWEQQHWRVEVTDEEGALLWIVVTLAIDAPPR